MRAALAIVLLIACGCDDSTASNQADLSTNDLTLALCAGAGLGKPVACSAPADEVCYPDNLTYCVCQAGEWACCGDALPRCPSTPPTVGGFCCPGAPAGPGSTELDCPYLCAAGQRTVCSCGTDFVWKCGQESCSDAGP